MVGVVWVYRKPRGRAAVVVDREELAREPRLVLVHQGYVLPLEFETEVAYVAVGAHVRRDQLGDVEGRTRDVFRDRQHVEGTRAGAQEAHVAYCLLVNETHRWRWFKNTM